MLRYGERSVSTAKVLALDRPVDIDRRIIGNCRCLTEAWMLA